MRKTKFLFALLPATLLPLMTGCFPERSAKTPLPKPTGDLASTATSAPAEAALPLTPEPKLPNSATQEQIKKYIDQLAALGFASPAQGVWIQSGDNTLLANHRGTVPLSAASITKIATSLVALETFGPDRQFLTGIGTTGSVKDGVLEGDLVVEGGEDPFFVWEEAIAVGNLLSKKGIEKVKGNLVIVGKFYMNFETNPPKTGELFRQGINSRIWTTDALAQYQTLPSGTAKPQIAISGEVRVSNSLPEGFEPLIRHHSFPVAELLKKMNCYSNNKMAEIFASAVGGAKVVAQKAAEIAGVPQAEIQLVNGSGLAVENKISPRAAVAMFRAIERLLERQNMTVADVFAVVGKDRGILENRSIPQLSVVKSGSLNNVSALVGALPTQQQGTVWFAIVNSGFNLEGFRDRQEIVLHDLVKQWGAVLLPPKELTPNIQRAGKSSWSESLN